MSDFSKGKWRYVEINNTVVIDDDRCIPVAFLTGCSMFSEQEYQANGRLIAAAPEMYEFLRYLFEDEVGKYETGEDIERRYWKLKVRIDGEED